jgi:hypothetical protein
MKTNKPLVRSAARVALGLALIVSLPAVAMLITDEVAWSIADIDVLRRSRSGEAEQY